MGVVGVFRYPQCFGLGLGGIEAIDHSGRNKGVAVAVYEEHGIGAVPDGIEG